MIDILITLSAQQAEAQARALADTLTQAFGRVTRANDEMRAKTGQTSSQMSSGLQALSQVVVRQSVEQGNLNKAFLQTGQAAQTQLNVFERLQQEVRQTTQQTQQATQTTRQFGQGLGTLTSGLRSLAASFGVVLGVQGLVQFIRSTVQAGLEMQRMMRTLQAATGSLEGAQRTMAFLVAESNRLGQSLQVMVPIFSQLASATKSTALEGERTRALFTSLVAAGQAVGLSTDAVGRSMVGLIQIISQNAIQLDEFRNQFASQIPGAMLATAKALKQMGVTTTGSVAEMLQLIDKQKLSVNDLVRGVTIGLGEIAKAAPDMSQTAEAAFQRLTNAIFATKAALAESGLLEFLVRLAREAERTMRFVGQAIGSAPRADEERLSRLREELIALGKLRASVQQGAEQPAGVLEQLRRFLGESPAEQIKNLDAEIIRVRTDLIALDKTVRAAREAQAAQEQALQGQRDEETRQLKAIDDARLQRLTSTAEAAALQKAAVGLTSARMQAEASTLTQLQALRTQALERDYQAAIDSSAKTARDLEQIEQAFLIRRADLRYQAALEDAAQAERSAKAEFDARMRALSAESAASQLAATGPKATVEQQRKANTDLAALGQERATLQQTLNAAMAHAESVRIQATMDREAALTGLTVDELKKRLEQTKLTAAQSLANTLEQLTAQGALLKEQIEGQQVSRQEGLQQLAAMHTSVLALTQAMVDEEMRIRLESVRAGSAEEEFIRLESAQRMGVVRQRLAREYLDAENAQNKEFTRLLKENEETLSAFFVRSLDLLVDQTTTFVKFFEGILLNVRAMFFKFLADLAAAAIARPITVLLTGVIGTTGQTATAQVINALGLGAEGAAGAAGGGLLNALGLAPALSFLTGQFKALGDVILGGAQSISQWVNQLIYPGVQDIGTSITTLSESLQLFGGAAAVGANLFGALTAETTAGRVGGSLGATAGLASIASTLGLLPAAFGPIGLALSAIVPLLTMFIGGQFSPAGPRFALGNLGGLGIGAAGGALAVSGAATSQIGRQERIPGGIDTAAIQDALNASVTRLVTGMVEALNQVALDPTALLGPTQQALNDALANALTINSSNAKNFQRDMEEQLKFVGVQVGSFFLRPLNEAFRQLESAELDEQLARLPQTTQGMVYVFTRMNEQLAELATVANTDVLRQLSSVRNRVEDFGNALADTARVISTAIVDQINDRLIAQANVLLDAPLATQIRDFGAVMNESFGALAALRTTQEALVGAGLNAGGVTGQLDRLTTLMIDTAATVSTEIVTGALAQLSGDLAQVTAQAVSVQASTVNTLFNDSLRALDTLFQVWSRMNAEGLDSTAVADQFERMLGGALEGAQRVMIEAFDPNNFGEFLAVALAIPKALTDLNPAFAELRRLAEDFAQVVGANTQRIQALEAELRSPEATVAVTTQRMADLRQAIADAGTSVEQALPLYAQLSEAIVANAEAEMAMVQAMGDLIARTEAILFARQGSGAQLTALQQDIGAIQAQPQTLDTMTELTELYEQQLSILEQMQQSLDSTLDSITETLNAQQSIVESVNQSLVDLANGFASTDFSSPEQLAELVTLYQDALSATQQLISIVEGGLDSIHQTLFSLMSLTEQQASLQAEMQSIFASMQATGQATPEQLIDLVEVTQQAIQVQQQLIALVESGLESIHQTLFSMLSMAEQQASLQAEMQAIFAEINATGQSTPEQLIDLVDLTQQALSVQQQLISVAKSGLESIHQTLFSLMSVAEQQASLQREMQGIFAEIRATGQETPEQLIELVDLTQQALSVQQQLTQSLQNTLDSLQQTLRTVPSPAAQLATVQSEINALMGPAMAGTATPEELAKLVALNQELLNLGEQNDLMGIQAEALANLRALEPLIADQLAASKSMEEQLVDQLVSLETALNSYLLQAQITEDQLIGQLGTLETALNSYLLQAQITEDQLIGQLGTLETALRGYLQQAQELELLLLNDLKVLYGIVSGQISETKALEDAIIAYLTDQATTLNESLIATYGTNNIQDIMVKIQGDSLQELQDINTALGLLFADQSVVKQVLLGAYPQSPGNTTALATEAIARNTDATGAIATKTAEVSANTSRPLDYANAAYNVRVVYQPAQQGGIVGVPSGLHYARGGLVPVMLEPGERVFTPPLAQAQQGALMAMNQAFPRFAHGGWTVPGSGAGDTVPAWVPTGSFVLNRTASGTPGFQQGGSVQASSQSSTPRQQPMVINITVNQRAGQSTRELVDEITRQLNRQWRSGNVRGPFT